MSSMIKSTVAVLLLAGLSGCAGTNFVRPDSDSLKNGQTTYSQVIANLANPAKRDPSSRTSRH